MRLSSSILLALAFAGVASAEVVRSTSGAMEIYSAAGGDNLVCKLDYGKTATVVEKSGDYVKVSAGCGTGWVAMNKVTIPNEKQNSKNIDIGTVDISGYLDDPTVVFTNDDNADADNLLNYNKDATGMVYKSEDRERVEFVNGDN
jgi:uncharacterized protein YraI